MGADESNQKAASSHSPKSLRLKCKAGLGAVVLLYSYKNRNTQGCEGFSGRALQTETGGGPLPGGGPLLLGLLAIGSRKAAFPSPSVF